MANKKLNKKTLDELMMEVLNEKKVTFPDRTNPKFNGMSDSGVTSFLDQFNITKNPKHRQHVANFYNSDGDAKKLSKRDIENAASKKKYLYILKKIAQQAVIAGIKHY